MILFSNLKSINTQPDTFSFALFDLLNLPCPENVQGRSFAEFFRHEQAVPSRNAVSAMMQADGKFVEARCVRTAQYKLIRNFSPSRVPETPFQLGQGALRERPVMELYEFAHGSL